MLSTLSKDGKLLDKTGRIHIPYPNWIPYGTSYASNSYGLAKGYTYGDGMVAVVRRPFKFSENPYNWKGTNNLGFALMEVRDFLKNNMQ